MRGKSARDRKKRPEIFIGMTGAVGTDMGGVTGMLADKLKTLGYDTVPVILSSMLYNIGGLVRDHDKNDEYHRIVSLMDAGDRLREQTNTGGALARLAISQIIEDRWRLKKSYGKDRGRAYILGSLKHPEEVAELRHTYGRSFWLISVYSPRNVRGARLTGKIRRGGTVDPGRHASKIMERDEHGTNPLGQNVRDTFALGDVFINTDANTRRSVDRFVELLFGKTFNTPTPEESGMMYALAGSKASSSLSRQVGASILTPLGDLISTGINEVPKAHGGHYITGDRNDAREWRRGYDSNTRRKTEALEEFLTILDEGNLLADNGSGENVIKKAREMKQVKNSAFLNLIEYGREVHAEMAALMGALRTGVPVTGCTMYCTTFPCHICAKHIIASGISRTVYIEPYPKSLAEDLYRDSITVDTKADKRTKRSKIQFEPFMGVSPRIYMDMFEMLPRKDDRGRRLEWDASRAEPRYRTSMPYYKTERYLSDMMSETMDRNRLEFKRR